MRTFFRRLASVAIWPRTTMRAILDAPRDRAIFALVFLATISAFISNGNQNVRGTATDRVPLIILLVALALVVTFLVMLCIFYLFAWIATMAGRFLEGEGTHAGVRTALAWGMAPLIWALVYRLPAALLGVSRGVARVDIGGEGWRVMPPGTFAGGCVVALIYVALEIAVLAWYLVVASRTLAEAHRFSAWRGFGTLVIVGITPLIIGIAALLATH